MAHPKWLIAISFNLHTLQLIVEKWEPYYYRQKLGELKDGDVFNGVKVKMVKSATR